jgi:hypothetical protein
MRRAAGFPLPPGAPMPIVGCMAVTMTPQHRMIDALRRITTPLRKPVARWCGAGPGPTSASDQALEVDLLRGRLRMLGLVATWAFAAVALIATVHAYNGSTGGAFLAGLGVVGLVLGRLLPRLVAAIDGPVQLRLLGSAFVITVALAMAGTEALMGLVRSTIGVSGIAVWIMLTPLLLPMRLPQAAVTLGGCAAMVPVAHGIAVAAGLPALTWYQLVAWAGPLVFSAVIAAAISCALSRQAMELARARRDLTELGRYRILHRLGSGGMGVVMEAEHTLLRRPVAVKLLHADMTTPELKRLFLGEAEATASLTSPHTVRLHDYGRTEDGRLYMVMELLDGWDLHRAVESGGPLPDWRVARVLHQACHALAEAHAAGISHRDITPSNLMLCRSGGDLDVLKILDFGLARATAGPDELVGTPGYIAPEAVVGRNHGSPAGDLYALGACAWWMLTGAPLQPEEDPEQILVATVNRPLPDLATAVPGIDPGLASLVLALLAKQPLARPSSAAAVRRRLATLPCFAQWDEAAVGAWWSARGKRRPQTGPVPVVTVDPARGHGPADCQTPDAA